MFCLAEHAHRDTGDWHGFRATDRQGSSFSCENSQFSYLFVGHYPQAMMRSRRASPAPGHCRRGSPGEKAGATALQNHTMMPLILADKRCCQHCAVLAGSLRAQEDMSLQPTTITPVPPSMTSVPPFRKLMPASTFTYYMAYVQ